LLLLFFFEPHFATTKGFPASSAEVGVAIVLFTFDEFGAKQLGKDTPFYPLLRECHRVVQRITTMPCPQKHHHQR